MWLEILCGFVIYSVFKKIFYELDVLDLEASYSNAIFSVANRLEKLYGGKAYVGLRIPDPDTGSRQNIDIVHVTNGEAVLVSVKNLSVFVTVNGDGSWVCKADSRHRTGRHPDPVAEAKKQVSILESYLERRGVALPEGYFSYKVILSNPNFRTIYPSNFPPEVVTYKQWTQLEPEHKMTLFDWIKGAFCGGKKEMQESFHQQLNFILSTSPIRDRLELKGEKYILGEFLEFKGKQEDMLALRYIKRLKVGRLIIQKTSLFGLDPSRLQVLCYPRDYRREGASVSEWTKVTVGSSTDVLFQPENSIKVRAFSLSSIVSLILSA